jgi:hypothetical protein
MTAFAKKTYMVFTYSRWGTHRLFKPNEVSVTYAHLVIYDLLTQVLKECQDEEQELASSKIFTPRLEV